VSMKREKQFPILLKVGVLLVSDIDLVDLVCLGFFHVVTGTY